MSNCTRTQVCNIDRKLVSSTMKCQAVASTVVPALKPRQIPCISCMPCQPAASTTFAPRHLDAGPALSQVQFLLPMGTLPRHDWGTQATFLSTALPKRRGTSCHMHLVHSTRCAQLCLQGILAPSCSCIVAQLASTCI